MVDLDNPFVLICMLHALCSFLLRNSLYSVSSCIRVSYVLVVLIVSPNYSAPPSAPESSP